MSFVTGTGVELLYANIAVGAAKASFTTEAVINDTTGMGVQARIPVDFWLPTINSVGRGIKIVARGVLGSTTVAPTYQLRIRAGSAQSNSGAILLGMASSFTPNVSMTNASWELEGDIIMKTPGAAGGANSTVLGMGLFTTSSAASTQGLTRICYGGGASPGTVTIQTDTTQYINVTATCGTSDPNNTITLQQLLVFGLN